MTFTAIVCANAQNTLTNGLVAFYPFNGNASDASGNGNNGTVNGTDFGFLADRFGNSTNSLWLNITSKPAFNLNGAYVSAPKSAALNFNSDFTMSCWVNLSNVTNSALPENLISDGPDSDSLNLRLQVNYGGNDLLQLIRGGAGSSIDVVIPQTRQSWWQATVVRSGTNTILYRNGNYLANAPSLTTSNTSTIYLGRHDNGGGNFSYYPLIGAIDDVRFYNRALSQSEIQQLYQAEFGPQTTVAPAARLDFSTLLIGGHYQLQTSHDLSSWINVGTSITAASASFTEYVDVTNSATFWRILTLP